LTASRMRLYPAAKTFTISETGVWGSVRSKKSRGRNASTRAPANHGKRAVKVKERAEGEKKDEGIAIRMLDPQDKKRKKKPPLK